MTQDISINSSIAPVFKFLNTDYYQEAIHADWKAAKTRMIETMKKKRENKLWKLDNIDNENDREKTEKCDLHENKHSNIRWINSSSMIRDSNR